MNAGATAGEVTPAAADRLKPRTLVITSLGYFMVILDTTAKNVALPDIGKDLHATVGGLQWVVDGYLLVFASLLLTAGALSDRYGARRLFAVGLSIFGAGSVLSAVARTPGELIAGQLVAGVGGALATPSSLALLSVTFTEPKERGRAFGLWATVAGAGTASGPLIGGLLVTLFGWQSVFLINIPVVAVGLWLVRRWLPPSKRNPERALDIPGQVAGVAALGALTYGVITAGEHGWSSTSVLVSLVGAAVAGALFIAIELRSSAPMFPLRLLRSARLSSSVFAGSAINFGTYSQMFLLALYFQTARGYGALQTGVAELPMTALCVLLPSVAGRVVGKYGPRRPLAFGLAAMSVGALCLSGLSLDTSYGWAVPGLLITGAGMAFSIPAVAAAAMTGVNPSEAGAASGVLNTARQVGGVLGVSVLGTVVGASIGTELRLALIITAVVQIVGALAAWIGLRTVAVPQAAAKETPVAASQKADPAPARN
ncbi:MFS transporter [Streptomyces sp.]|uniref:MFS transporter n=1 Tax=Streptomyces sp. TaxID=1931 RepID=UPI002F410D52